MAVGAIGQADQEMLRARGWHLIPATALADPDEYRGYIRESLGEFTIAKEQYVRPRSGWFSDRSVCYLAAARPVITQDTGFGELIPTGEGLFAFSSEEEALEAIQALAREYARHSAAAIEIAQEFFSAEQVLGGLLSETGLL
jgi:hypothetical protein